MSVRIGLADDQALVRQGLKAVLNDIDGFAVLVEAADGAHMLAELATTPVDVVVTDIRMPGMDGMALCKRIRQAHATPVILLTTFDEDGLLEAAVEAGACGFLLKDASPEDLAAAVLCAVRGETWLQPVPTAPFRERLEGGQPHSPGESFSVRELAVLRLMAGGYSNREIARSLFLAEGTVKNYVSDILAKLEARDRTRAVLKAISLHII
ncbi:MAG TPA: response regulator transcription factor [Gammaproteobacteria bacterium]|nr:response regulator transcription factor [Gammaproteobacteria bacterium]